jgi:hypothetical protein
MRVTIAHWLLVLVLLCGGFPGELSVESPVKHAAEEDSSERQDESKAAASRKRNVRAQKTKKRHAPLLAAPVWPSCTLLADDRRLFFSLATPWNPNLQQLHQVFRI